MSAVFEITLVRWGSSLGFSIPKALRDGMDLKPGDKMRMTLKDNKVYLEKADSSQAKG